VTVAVEDHAWGGVEGGFEGAAFAFQGEIGGGGHG